MWTVDKAVQWAQLAVLVIGLAVSAATCSRAFDKIADHETRLEKIETADKASGKELQEKLQQLQKSIDYATWRIDALSKDLDKATNNKGTKR